jgi:putative hydrolase of the HAD superfamily
MTAFQTDPRWEHIDAEVCRHFAVADPERVIQAARAAFFSMPVGRLKLFRGALRVLRTLQQHGVKNFIVTFGNPETQRDKVRALGLDDEASLQDILYVDTARPLSKQGAFDTVLQSTAVSPRQVLVVGDRPGGEIRAGKMLGTTTVRIRHGEFVAVEPAGPEEEPDFEIAKIEALLELPLQFGAKSASRRPRARHAVP